MSQAVLAHLVGHSERWLRDVETGTVDLWVSDAVRIAEALGVGIMDLLQEGSDGSSKRQLGSRGGQQHISGNRLCAVPTPRSHDADDDVHRVEPPTTADYARLDGGFNATDTVDGRLIESVSAFSRQLRGLFGALSASAVQRVAHTHLETLQTLMSHPMPSRYRRELESAAACTAVMAGMVSTAIGKSQDAIVYLRIAMQLARDAGDAESEALALMISSRLSSQICPGGLTADPARALQQLEAADRCLSPGTASPVARAWVLMRRAEELAAAGHRATANRLVDEADRLVDGAGATPADGLCMRWDKSVNIAFRGHVSILSGDSIHGIRLLELALQTIPAASPSTRTLVTADLGGAYARVGEVDRACDLLREAAGAAAKAGFSDALIRIHRIRHHQLHDYVTAPTVLQLDDMLSTITRCE